MFIPNSTQIPNVILDNILPDLSDTELRVILIIARQTYGWVEDINTSRRKSVDWISYSQLVTKTGRQTAAIAKAIHDLEEKRLIDILGENGLLIPKDKRLGSKLYYRIHTSSESEDHLFGKRNSESEDTKVTETKIKEKNIIKKENQQEDKDINSSFVGNEFNQFSEISSKTSVIPMTALERWEMAKDLDVPLLIVRQTEKNFWDYIETPKGKSKNYKTTYKTVKKWIEMKLQKGEFQHCNETEKLQLDIQHPDIIKQRDEAFAWARENKLTE